MDLLVKRIRRLTCNGVAIDEWFQATVSLFDELPDEWQLTHEWQLSDSRQTVRCRKGGYHFVCGEDTRTEAEILRDRVFSAVSGDSTIEVESSWRPALPCLLSSGWFPSRLTARVELTFTRLSDLPDFKETVATCSAMDRGESLFPDFPSVWPELTAELVAAGNAMGPQPGLWLPFSFDGGRGFMLLTEKLAERAFLADVFARGELTEGTAIYRQIHSTVDGTTYQADLGLIRAV